MTLTLNGGDPSVDGGLNFDKTDKGSLDITVPKGWKLTVDFTNKGQLPHSAAVVSSSSATSPAFSGAATPNPTSGTAPGKSASFSFTASKTGSYRIACLVPGHEPGGMWATLKIASSGKPTIQ